MDFDIFLDADAGLEFAHAMGGFLFDLTDEEAAHLSAAADDAAAHPSSLSFDELAALA